MDFEKARALEKINPSLRALLINNHEACLNEIEWNDRKFIGKPAGKLTDLQNLELLKNNVFSLLKKLMPSTVFSDDDILLIAIPVHE
jgi:hypothetical protein